jgi:carboxylesterase
MGTLTVAQKGLLAAMGLALLAVLLVGLTSLVMPWRTAALLWGGLILAFLLWVAVRPVATAHVVPKPAPATSVAEAEAKFAALAALDGDDVLDIGRSQLWSHGERRPTACVLFHGISNSTASFRDLAPALHARGMNVLAPRIPGNGMVDTTLPTLGDMTADGLAGTTDAAIDIAAGLGSRVCVVGISGGGVLAGWALAARPEVTDALLIAPSHGLARLGARLNAYVMRLMLSLPPLSIWKDPVRRASGAGRPHTMKRQVTTGFGEVMRLGLATRRRLEDRVAAGRAWDGGRLALLLNEADTAVDNGEAERVAADFARAGVAVETRWIPAACALGHEIIDPTEPDNRPELTGPLLVAYLTEGAIPECLSRPAAPLAAPGVAAAPIGAGPAADAA